MHIAVLYLSARKLYDSFRKDLSFTRDVIYLLVRPKAIACGADLCFSPDVFFKIFFLSTRSPRCVGRPA